MTTFKSQTTTNYASYNKRNDGQFQVFFGYWAQDEFTCTDVKVYKTEKMALSKINKYIS